MKWYFAIDEAGGLGETGALAKLAVISAQALGQLQPVLLYHGAANHFTGWMQARGVQVAWVEPTFLPAMRAAQAAGVYRPYSLGHWLRLAIPQVETQDEYVVYTDCDVVFTRPVAWRQIRPRVLAAGPEFAADRWDYFNSGVMVLNVPALRLTYPVVEAHILRRILEHPEYNDQWALNEIYAGFWERLDPALNYKPYWPYATAAGVLHFHGPKLEAIAAIAGGRWPRDNDTAAQYARLVEENAAHYVAWLTVLGELMQTLDMGVALRLLDLASQLIRHRKLLA